MSYLKDEQLPPNPDKVRKIKKRTVRFIVLNDKLYKGGFSEPYLRCVEEEEAKYILKEVHKGICGDHMGEKSLVRKIMKASYF